MSQLLLTTNNHILFVADHIIWGTFEGEEKWALYDENNQLSLYALDNDYKAETYTGELPEDIHELGKYIYDNGTIIPNPDWHPSKKQNMETQIAELQATIDDLLTNVLPMLMGE